MMPENLPGLIQFGLMMGLLVFCLMRLAWRRLAPVRTVNAVVAAKNTVESFSKYKGNGKHIRYVIVFEAEGKRLSFYVSEFSFGGYRKGERGKLTYQGDRLIDFS